VGDDRIRLGIPDDLAEKLDQYFGASSNTWAGVVLAACWYAVERYEAEHGVQPDLEPTHDRVTDDEQ